MVSRYALIREGVVENVVRWDGESDWTPPDDTDCVRLDDATACGPGDRYDGDTFTTPEAEPEEAAPLVVTVDPDALEAARAQVAKATTVQALRSAVANALTLLTPEA